MPPALHAAATAKFSGRLRGFDLAVLLVLWDELDLTEFRRLKASSLQWMCRDERGTRPDESNLRRAVRRLEEQCYLERGPRDDGIATFRLIADPSARRSRMTPESLPLR